jgi:hypothetical protein
MNTTEDGTAPLGEAPDLATQRHVELNGFAHQAIPLSSDGKRQTDVYSTGEPGINFPPPNAPRVRPVRPASHQPGGGEATPNDRRLSVKADPRVPTTDLRTRNQR